MTRKDLAAALALAEEKNLRFVSLQFTDIVGQVKSVQVPMHQLEEAVEHGKWFDGSSIEGFARIAESDMFLVPDLTTFSPIPWEPGIDADGKQLETGSARVICDVFTPNGDPFAGDPRWVLRRQMEKAKSRGYTFNTGPELEFFLLRLGDGRVEPLPHDAAGYFDLSADLATDVRKEMMNDLEEIGIEVETAHHEVAIGQHEIDFKYAEAVQCADNVVTFRFVVKKVALDHGHGLGGLVTGTVTYEADLKRAATLGQDVVDYVNTRYARLQERLNGAVARPYVFSHGNVFPNFSLIGGQTALRGWLFYLIVPQGPLTSEVLSSAGFPPDIEPEHPKLGHLMVALAARGPEKLAEKRRSQ